MATNVLSGKVALVTGVSRDGQVGQAVARALASEGAALAIVARSRENVEARAQELKADGARVLPIAVNLVDELAAVQDGDVLDVWPVAARGANR